MPMHIKAILSAIVALVAYAVYQSEGLLSPDLPRLVVPALAIFMIVSLWLFPETSHKKK